MSSEAERRPEIMIGFYRHYKGKDYLVRGVARHSETGEWLVVYQKQYDDFGLAVRPYDMFVENVEIDGRLVPRFQRIGSPEATIPDPAAKRERHP